MVIIIIIIVCLIASHAVLDCNAHVWSLEIHVTVNCHLSKQGTYQYHENVLRAQD